MEKRPAGPHRRDRLGLGVVLLGVTAACSASLLRIRGKHPAGDRTTIGHADDNVPAGDVTRFSRGRVALDTPPWAVYESVR